METNLYCLNLYTDRPKVAKRDEVDIKDSNLTVNCDFEYYHRISASGHGTGNGKYSIIIKNAYGIKITHIEYRGWKAYLLRSEFCWEGYITAVRFVDKYNSDVIAYARPSHTIYSIPNNREFYILRDLAELISRVTQHESVAHYEITIKIEECKNLKQGISLEGHMANIKILTSLKDDVIEAHAKDSFEQTTLNFFKSSILRLAKQVGLSIDEIEI